MDACYILLMDITELGKAVSSKTRVRILQLLSENSYTASGLHKKYIDEFDDDKHRESIYRELENLVDLGLLEKEYESKNSSLIYRLEDLRYIVDLSESEVNPK